MKRFAFLLASLCALLTVNPALSQTKEIQDEIQRKLATARAASRTEEHIEIFRRLLLRVLPSRTADNPLIYFDPYQPYTKNLYNPALPTSSSLAEGVYLKGYGVVFTVTTPPQAHYHPQTTTEKPADKPLSPWEREQRELRGEKTETPKKIEARPPTLSDTLLRLLGENGKNFTELAPDEQVTITVVFRPSASPARVPYYNYPSPLVPNTYPEFLNTYPYPNPFATYSGFPFTPSPYAGLPILTNPSQYTPKTDTKDEQKKLADDMFAPFRNSMALGALHMKQGKMKEAEKVYRNLLDQCDELLKSLEKLPPETSRVERLTAVMMGIELHGKLAQINLAEGKPEEASKALKAAAEFNRKLEQFTTVQQTPSASPPAPVPAKLVISASKKNLDRIGDGKMTFDEFRKAALIEYTGIEKDVKP